MSSTTASQWSVRRASRVALVVMGLLIAGVSAAFLAPTLLLPALLLAVVLVPCGAAFGLAARVVLAVRRRNAGVRVAEVEPDSRYVRAASFGTGLQKTGRRLSIALLALAVAGGGYDIAIWQLLSRLDDAGYVSNNTTFLGNLLLGLGGLMVTPPLLALAAIPVASVLTVLQIRDRQTLAGEAHALRTRTSAYRTIRTNRILSDVTLGLYEAGALAVIALAASGALTRPL